MLYSHPFHCLYVTLDMFFCCTFLPYVWSLFLSPVICFLSSSSSPSRYPSLTHSQRIPSSSSLPSLPFSYLNPSIIYCSPTSHLSLPPPPLLHHSIFVLVQLQKWDLAVTNLLAKPPRAPCGGASSQRTRVIDWTWGKLCQAGHHDWISCLIINSLLPQVLWGDTSVMWHIFMTHGALDC